MIRVAEPAMADQVLDLVDRFGDLAPPVPVSLHLGEVLPQAELAAEAAPQFGRGVPAVPGFSELAHSEAHNAKGAV